MQNSWWKEGVVYQIYPRSFYDSNGDGIGDLKGIVTRLDYLKKLGVDIIWLSPVYSSPNDDNGYDICNYYNIMSEFGTLTDMDKLISKIHEYEMKIIMDLVVNHTSDEHPWFIQSRSSRNNPYRNFYIWRKGRGNDLPPNNWGSRFGGSAWEYDSNTGEYYLHLFSRKQPDLNWENPRVREEIYKIMHWWLNKGIDGFRMDVINMLSKDPDLPDVKVKKGENYADGSPYYINGPRIHEFLQEMSEQVLSHYNIMTVGETPGNTPAEALKYVASDREELNMLIHFELIEATHGQTKWEKTDWNLLDIKEIFNKWYYALENKGWNSLYMSNHDQPRQVSRFADDGKYRIESAKMLATLLHTFPGTPYIYQGEEIGMSNVAFPSIKDYRDIETLNWYQEKKAAGYAEEEIMTAIYRVGRDNARTPMQWNSQINAGFTNGTPWLAVNPNHTEINVDEALGNPDSVFYYYQKLIKLRKKYAIMVYGNYQPLMKDNPHVFSYLREFNDQRLLVIINFVDEEAIFELPAELCFKEEQLLISNYPVPKQTPLAKLPLRPYESQVYLLS